MDLHLRYLEPLKPRRWQSLWRWRSWRKRRRRLPRILRPHIVSRAAIARTSAVVIARAIAILGRSRSTADTSQFASSRRGSRLLRLSRHLLLDWRARRLPWLSRLFFNDARDGGDFRDHHTRRACRVFLLTPLCPRSQGAALNPHFAKAKRSPSTSSGRICHGLARKELSKVRQPKARARRHGRSFSGVRAESAPGNCQRRGLGASSSGVSGSISWFRLIHTPPREAIARVAGDFELTQAGIGFEPVDGCVMVIISGVFHAIIAADQSKSTYA